jgi:type I restriction enzyme M protein
MDPSCGSAGFLLHAMEWASPAHTPQDQKSRKHDYASKYLWGIDIEPRAAKTSRALMLIAGDGHTNIFGPDVSGLDPRDWYTNKSGQYLMTQLSKTQLLKNPIPYGETFADKEKAWEYFDELKFDLILANPPFAGEVKEKNILTHYELAKPALKRAKDKTAKEERDVLFIERIIKMLRPGGRAAIVLPQGKFNNSSLAFIREWVLRKARLLAVVGLHGNSFKPHTGTKTSVLVIQKYTEDQLAEIIKVQEDVKDTCPDYALQIEELLSQYEADIEVAEEKIPEEIFELLLEEFPEREVAEETDEEAETKEDEEQEAQPQTLEEKLDAIDEKIAKIKNSELKAKTKLSELDDEVEIMELTQKAEIEIIQDNWTTSKKELTEHLKNIKVSNLSKIKALKETQKETAKSLKAEIKSYGYSIPLALEEKLILTNKGKLQLLLQNEDSINKLRNRFIDSEVAKQLDYPIFMAVSEQGGKNNSGDYEYQTDSDGNIVEDAFGNPEIKQDLVNHRITRDALLAMVEKADDFRLAADPEVKYEAKELEPCIAEAFIQFAIEQQFDFWKN